MPFGQEDTPKPKSNDTRKSVEEIKARIKKLEAAKAEVPTKFSDVRFHLETQINILNWTINQGLPF